MTMERVSTLYRGVAEHEALWLSKDTCGQTMRPMSFVNAIAGRKLTASVISWFGVIHDENKRFRRCLSFEPVPLTFCQWRSASTCVSCFHTTAGSDYIGDSRPLPHGRAKRDLQQQGLLNQPSGCHTEPKGDLRGREAVAARCYIPNM
jgi:hypothetical protein